jgi:hypothetical protein
MVPICQKALPKRPTSTVLTMKSDLIYDVGANNGNDTDHYLRRGFRVLAIEANPQVLQVLCRVEAP